MAALLGRLEATATDLLDTARDMAQVFPVVRDDLEDLDSERNMLAWELEPGLLEVLTLEQEEHPP